MQQMRVPAARPGSWEDVLHTACGENRLLMLEPMRGEGACMEERGHRAIGVVYHPQFEHLGNFVPTVLPLRYDAFIHIEETQALHPLHDVLAIHEGDVPETYPTGM